MSSSRDFQNFVKRVFFTVLWLVLLLVLAWPLAYFCAAWWVFFLPFEELFDIAKEGNGHLFKVVLWPKTLAKAIMDGSEDFPHPFRDNSYTAIA